MAETTKTKGQDLKSPLLSNTVQDKTAYDAIHCQRTPRFKTYKRRWYVLTMYTAIALVCNMDWNTWGPISEPCQIVFGWGNWQILFLSSWAAISLILGTPFMTWLMDTKGEGLITTNSSNLIFII